MKKSSFFFIIVAIFIATSCNLEKPENNLNKAAIQVMLTDAPADYEAVLIDVQDVRIKYSSDSNGWHYLDNVERGVYNLLELTGGLDTLIAQSVIDTGTIIQVRLVLGENNSLVLNGDTLDLSTPSAQQSGLKIKLNQKVEGGINYKLVLDFDASKSIVEAGKSGKFNLKPVIRAYLEAQDGAIMGSISDTIAAVVYAIHESDSMSSYPDSTGKFIIQGLPEGSYDVFIDASDNWVDTTLYGIEVELGKIYDLGYIELKSN